jgi:hypothetical protein
MVGAPKSGLLPTKIVIVQTIEITWRSAGGGAQHRCSRKQWLAMSSTNPSRP